MNEKKNCLCLEQISWALGQATGRQFITALVSTYILIFMTDVFGVPAAAAGVIMTAATVWDAINDPIMGGLADRTKSRWGTYRPYLLLIPLPLSIVSVLLFAAPDLSTTGKIVYAAGLHIRLRNARHEAFADSRYRLNLFQRCPESSRWSEMMSFLWQTFIASIMILIVTSFTTNFVKVIGGDNPGKRIYGISSHRCEF